MSLEECVGLRYKLHKDAEDNFDEIMAALGVNFVLRKLGNVVSPVMELLRDGEEWTVKMTTVVINTVTTFRLGEEFDNVTADGRRVKTTVTRDGNKLFVLERGHKIFKSVLEFSPEEVVMTFDIRTMNDRGGVNTVIEFLAYLSQHGNVDCGTRFPYSFTELSYITW